MEGIVNNLQGLSVTGQGRRAFLRTTGLVSATALAGAVLASPSAAMTVAAPPATAVSPIVPAATVDIGTLPRVQQKMVAPPFLPKHEQVASTGPKVVEVTLT